MKEFIEIPFGAKDSELCGWEYTIPEGYTASIENGKIIVKKEENKDEKIRKEIIHLVKKSNEYGGYALHKWEADRMLAWLEKQGESKFEQSIQKGDNIITNEDGTHFNVSQLERVSQKVTDTKETAKKFLKSAEIMNGNDELADEYRFENQGDQNHAWSEEDEEMLSRIDDSLKALRFMYINGGEEDRKTWKAIDEEIKYIKSLKDRVQPQNFTVTDEELSQAKKDAYNDALDKIEYHSGKPTFEDGWSAAIWYLKKRNTQFNNNWKPSEEQMQVLIWCLPLFADPKLKETLKSLIDDLKKL